MICCTFLASAWELSNLLWSCATAGHHNKELFAAAGGVATPAVHLFTRAYIFPHYCRFGGDFKISC